MFYTVFEIQKDKNNNFGCLHNFYDNEDDALAQFYTVCAAAAKSDIPYHAAMIRRSDGLVIEGRIFEHSAE